MKPKAVPCEMQQSGKNVNSTVQSATESYRGKKYGIMNRQQAYRQNSMVTTEHNKPPLCFSQRPESTEVY